MQVKALNSLAREQRDRQEADRSRRLWLATQRDIEEEMSVLEFYTDLKRPRLP